MSIYINNEFRIFHPEASNGCVVGEGMSARWAENTFKRGCRLGGVSSAYSFSSLRNLHRQTLLEVPGASSSLVNFLMGNSRYATLYRRCNLGAFRRRAAEHFEKTMVDYGIL
jgi:hypothetical protein